VSTGAVDSRDRSSGDDAPRVGDVRGRSNNASSGDVRAAPPATLQKSFAFGVLAMTPLFVVYECLQRTGSVASRNTAEYVLTLPLNLFGTQAANLRAALLLLLVLVCAWRCFHSELGLFGRIGRVALEGAIAALILGPLLLILQRLLALETPPLAAASAPAFTDALHHASGAAFEEIVFRVGLQSAFFLLLQEMFLFFTDQRLVSRVAADVTSILLGALVFAAAHLAPVVGIFGAGGEPFSASVFAWRVIAGIALGILFRVRGPGVAAWTHALFNTALFVGAGPDVFL